MGKKTRERALAENEAKAVARMLRVSPQKLNLVAQLIRGKKVATALADLEFSRKRIAREACSSDTTRRQSVRHGASAVDAEGSGMRAACAGISVPPENAQRSLCPNACNYLASVAFFRAFSAILLLPITCEIDR